MIVVFANKLAFTIIYHGRKKRIKSGIKKIDDNLNNNFKPNDDISEMITIKMNIKTEYENNGLEEMNYDIKYQERALLKVQLFVLVLFFFGATFIDSPVINSISTDIINVVTCFTLIILYIDKRREFGIIEPSEKSITQKDDVFCDLKTNEI